MKGRAYPALVGAVALACSATEADSTIVSVFDGITAGVRAFNAAIAAAGGAVSVDAWTTLPARRVIKRGGYFVTQNDGGRADTFRYGTMSGLVMSVAPDYNAGVSPPETGRLPAGDYLESGITLTFDSPVNAVGFEVGDWATYCFDPVTELFVSFDGGEPVIVASASEEADGLFPSRSTGDDVFEIFLAAFDDSGAFTRVSFWGNGIDEALYFGGQVRHALLDEGTLPPAGTVPLPPAGLLLDGGLGCLGLLRRGARTTRRPEHRFA